MLNIVVIVLIGWGLYDIFTGLRTLSLIPVILLGRLFGRFRKVQIGYTKKELAALEKRYNKPLPEKDEHGIPYL